MLGCKGLMISVFQLSSMQVSFYKDFLPLGKYFQLLL